MSEAIGILIFFILLWIWWKSFNFKKRKIRVLDSRGYERDGFGKLVHRQIAYKFLYKYPQYPLRFREYDVHHKDRNKRNNAVENLQIVTREEHKKIHGILT